MHVEPAIEIVDYDSSWPSKFAAIAQDLRSTQITLEQFDDTRHPAALTAAGFDWRSDIDRDHCPPGMSLPPDELTKRFANCRTPVRANVHLRIAGRFNQQYALLCRDYLRTHGDAAHAYAAVKRALATAFPTDIDSYYEIKDPVFDIIMSGAREWAASTGWKPE